VCVHRVLSCEEARRNIVGSSQVLSALAGTVVWGGHSESVPEGSEREGGRDTGHCGSRSKRELGGGSYAEGTGQ